MSGKVRWRLITLTYNVNGKQPNYETLARLLADENLSAGDFVAIGLQELTHSDSIGTVPPELTWSKHIAEWMILRGCVLIKSTFMASNRLLLFSKAEILPLIDRVDFRYLRSTMCGLAGYKGSIAVRIEFGGQNASLCFITSHLFHSEKMYWKRVDQYRSTYAQCTFRDKDSGPEGSKVVIWMGDLNWRVDTSDDAGKVAAEVAGLEGNSKLIGDYLQENDQLKRAMTLDHAFHHFKEGPINFLPTYRLEVGTTKYDLKRVPSWCDRILYTKSNDLHLVRYNSNTRILESDHFPVVAEFACTINRPQASQYVQFLPLTRWYAGVPLSCRFRYCKSFWKREGSYKDWIGIYDTEIENVEAPLKYVFALTTFDEVFEGEPTVVAEFSSLETGIYRAAYFSYNRGCLVGFSMPFAVSAVHNESSISDHSVVSASEKT